MKKHPKVVLTLLATSALIALSLGQAQPVEAKKKKEPSAEKIALKDTVENKDKALKGGELKYALVTDSPFKGILNSALYTDSIDSTILSFLDDGLFTTDENRDFTQNGMATYQVDVPAKTVTVQLKKDLKWSDGQPLTIDDYIFTHEFIANKDYPGVRYPDAVGDVDGAAEYHAGKAKHIAGLEKVDDLTVKIHFKNMKPNINSAGGPLLSYAIPKHIFEKISFKKVQSSDAVRKNVVGNGPFTIKTITPGESLTLVPNKYYYKGRPNLDKVTLEVVSSKNIASEMKNGNYDIAGMPSSSYDAYKDAKNFDLLSAPLNAFGYIGFKLGKWDKEKQEVAPNPNAKLADPELRKAIAYAINLDEIGQKFYNGTRYAANTLLPPVFKEHTDKVEAFSYNPKKANELLDKAGYKDVDGDGFREDKKGKPLVLYYATTAGGENDDAMALAYVQWWEKVGLKVKLTTGRPIEYNAFYDKIQSDDPEIDLYAASWGGGADADPAPLWGRTTQLNYTRFASSENDELIKDISSDKAFDPAYRQAAYDKWQQYAHDDPFAIPTFYMVSLTAVNKRVKYYDVKPGSEDGPGSLYRLAVTSDKRVSH